MNNSAFWFVVILLSVLTTGCGKGPDTTRPSPEATPATEEVNSASGKCITNSIGMKLTLIPAGEFMMGSPDSDSDAGSRGKPQHRVRITKPFYLGKYEVTQGQYGKVMGKNPSSYKESGPDAPVEAVSWRDAQEFCRKLSELAEEKKAGRCYRLPTEAQWEYACRAGGAEKYCYGDDASHLGDYAWYNKNSDGKTHQVGQKKPNAWGLYDMHGNVYEWCEDWYDRWYYANSPTDDPTGPSGGSYPVLRGGGWHDYSQGRCRSADRSSCWLGNRHAYLGFRVALVPSECGHKEQLPGTRSETSAANESKKKTAASEQPQTETQGDARPENSTPSDVGNRIKPSANREATPPLGKPSLQEIEPRATFRGHTKVVKAVVFSPDGKTLATGSWDGTVKLWTTATGQMRATLQAFTLGVSSVASAPDGKTLAAGSWKEPTVKLWNPAMGQERSPLKGDAGGGPYGVNSVVFSPDGKTLATACSDKTAKLWNVDTGQMQSTLSGHTHFVLCVAFSPEGKTLATGSFDYGVKLWDASTGKERATLSPGSFSKSSGHTGSVKCVAFSPDTKTLATGSADMTVKLWNTATGNERITLEGHTGDVTSLAFSPDGKTLATGSHGPSGEVKLWDTTTGQELATLRGHTKWVESVAFSPDGKTLATGSLDLTVKLWDVATIPRREATHIAKKTDTDPIATLINALSSADARERQQAANSLGYMRQKAKPAVPALVEALEDKDAGVRRLAVIALAQIGSPEAKAALVEVFRDKNVDVNLRGVAAKVLGGFRSEASVVLPALIEALEDQNDYLRISAVSTLGKMGPEAKVAVPALVTVLIYELNELRQSRQVDSSTPSRDSHRYSLAVTLNTLGLIAPNPSEAVPALVPALTIATREGGREAKNALKKIYPLALESGRPRMTPSETQAAASRVIPRLIEALDHQDPLIREGAAEAIGLTGPPAKTAVAALTKALEEENSEIRVAAALAIWRVDGRAKAALPILIEALDDEDVGVRYAVVRALGRIGPAAKDAVPALVGLAIKDKTGLRDSAAVVLVLIGPEAVASLADPLSSDDPRVRERAAHTIAEIFERSTNKGFSVRDPARREQVNREARRRIMPQPEPLVAALASAVSDENAFVREAAARALGEFGPDAKTAVPALVERLKDDRNVRWRTVLTLGKIGPAAIAAFQPLIETLKDQDRNVRWAAAEALEKIDPEVAADAVSRATADRPTKVNDKGDKLTLLGFDRLLPAILEPGEQLKVRCSYTFASGEQCHIWVRPFTDGKKTPGYGTSGSPKYGKGDGEHESMFRFRSPARIDQIHIIMSYGVAS